MTNRAPAEVFPPGEFLSEELEARGWTQLDLAEIIGCSHRLVNEVITGKRSMTANTAQRLGEALGTSAEFWMNLQNAYTLHRTGPTNGVVAKRARLFCKAPIREMVKRGWIEAAENPEVVEQRLLDFFEIKSLDEEPELWPHAARKATPYGAVTPAQWAWLFRSKKLATSTGARSYSDGRFKEGLEALKLCTHNPEEILHVPKILADAGVRLVVVEPLHGTKIDGASFWLDKKSPVVALSLRYDRIDCFWFTLLHELAHVKNQDSLKVSYTLDVDLVGDKRDIANRPDEEQMADDFAAEFLVDQEELSNFILRIKPLYSKTRIQGFAKRVGVHPGIVVGQLQHVGEITYAHSRNMLVKVRHLIAQSVLIDGWGSVLPADL